jgi:hypothetical protein
MASTTDEKIAKENRLRLSREEGERAMKEAAEDAIAVRKNMARLRELRLAKEAETASVAQAASVSKPATPVKRRAGSYVGK